MDVLGRPKGSYPESFVLISLLEVCQEWGGQEQGVHRGRLGFLTGDLENTDILDDRDYLVRPQGSYPESFVFIFILG